ncbi:MAG: 1,4-dihydroxy-2-naphthoate polyprenyltransferase [Bacteroidales bacterium]|nr:1,4-dihydroxy-2-naphthoate polyprenyltransferase [Bacteroidales bacterium]
MASWQSWVKAARLRTLPLALASIAMGGAVAATTATFNLEAVLAAGLTTLFLQVLSNMANDYGDSKSGIDNAGRVGPRRTVQSGEIRPKEMKTAVMLFSILSLISGLWLVFGIADIAATNAILFVGLGLMAIAAAIKYTVGKNPYGYVGLGDVFVFLFFGLLGVAGTYFLAAGNFDPLVLLPASALGLLSTGVLNLNNMRDIDNDRANGKRTLVVKMGSQAALTYHSLLVLLPFVLLSTFLLYSEHQWYAWLFLLSFPLFAGDLLKIYGIRNPANLDPFLKRLALMTLLLTLLFAAGLNL